MFISRLSTINYLKYFLFNYNLKQLIINKFLNLISEYRSISQRKLKSNLKCELSCAKVLTIIPTVSARMARISNF